MLFMIAPNIVVCLATKSIIRMLRKSVGALLKKQGFKSFNGHVFSGRGN